MKYSKRHIAEIKNCISILGSVQRKLKKDYRDHVANPPKVHRIYFWKKSKWKQEKNLLQRQYHGVSKTAEILRTLLNDITDENN